MHIDIPLLIILLILCGIGLAVLYSASGENLFYVERQATFMVIGLISMIFMAQFPPRGWERYAMLIYFGGLLALIAVLFVGVGAKGAQRWLDLGVTRFQPSELMKIAVPMMLSAFLSKRYLPPSFKHVCFALVATAIPVFLIARQPDLGTSLIVFSSGFFALFLAGLGKRYLVTTALVAMAALPTLWFYVMRDYQKQRVLTLLSPEQDKLGAGWNIMQSTTAIGSGGWSGKGWTEGTQSQLNFLPESHRLYYCRSGGRVRVGGRAHHAHPLLTVDWPLSGDRVKRAIHVRPPNGRNHGSIIFRLYFCQHGHGFRYLTRGWRTLTLYQLRWHCNCDSVSWIWYSDGHQHRTKTNLR